MGRQAGDQSQLFYLFNLEDLRTYSGAPSPTPINPIETPFYGEADRPSVDPELMLRMLIVG